MTILLRNLTIKMKTSAFFLPFLPQISLSVSRILVYTCNASVNLQFNGIIPNEEKLLDCSAEIFGGRRRNKGFLFHLCGLNDGNENEFFDKGKGNL